MPRKTTRIDLHSHTKGSDGMGTPAAIAMAARKAGLHGLALTDHHTNCTPEVHKVAKALRAVGVFPLIGCEYSTDQGHLLIFGVTVEKLQWGMYPKMQRVVDDVNAAGGACITPHPFKGYHKWLGKDLWKIDGLAAVEGFNGRTEDDLNQKAADIANTRNIPLVASSDAHSPHELGSAWTEFEGRIRGYRKFLEALKAGAFTGMVAQTELDRRAAEEARWQKSAVRYSSARHGTQFQMQLLPPHKSSDSVSGTFQTEIERAESGYYNNEPELDRIMEKYRDTNWSWTNDDGYKGSN